MCRALSHPRTSGPVEHCTIVWRDPAFFVDAFLLFSFRRKQANKRIHRRMYLDWQDSRLAPTALTQLIAPAASLQGLAGHQLSPFLFSPCTFVGIRSLPSLNNLPLHPTTPNNGLAIRLLSRKTDFDLLGLRTRTRSTATASRAAASQTKAIQLRDVIASGARCRRCRSLARRGSVT